MHCFHFHTGFSEGGWMKATPVPLHKVLGSHTLSQNSYAPGQVLQKN